MSTAYPPAPWHLTGAGLMTVWRVPTEHAPGLPPGARGLPLGRGRVAAGSMLVDYRPGGDMAYRELLVGLLVRTGARPALSITDIWVDSPASRAGGRALWAVPKELADFEPGPTTSVVADGELLARVRDRGASGPWLPVRGRSHVVQERDGAALVSPIAAGGRLRRARLTWDVPPYGPLGWLATGRPLLSLAADPFDMSFG